MAIGYTPVQLIALSALLQDRGLQLPAALESKITSLRNTDSLTGKLSAIATHPRTSTSYSSVIDSLREKIPGFSLTAPAAQDQLPVSFRATDVIGTLKSRGDAILANGLKGFLDHVTVSRAAIVTTYDILGSIDQYQSATFDSILPGARNYTDLVTNGFTASFGSGATDSPAFSSSATITAAQRQTQTRELVQSLQRIKNLYDFSDLENLGQPFRLIQHLYRVGAYWNTNLHRLMTAYRYEVDTITSTDNIGLTQLMSKLTVADCNTILKVTETVLPTGVILASGADLLDIRKLLPARVVSQIPGGNLAGLGQKMAFLGITGANFDEVLAVLDGLSLVDIPYLDQMTMPLPTAEVSRIRNSLPSGAGLFQNPTIDDILGAVSGVRYDTWLDVLRINNTAVLTKDAGTQLLAAADLLLGKLTSGTVIAGDDAAFIAEVDAFAADASVAAELASTNEAIQEIVDQLTLEFDNTDKAGIQFASNIQAGSAPTLIDSFQANVFRSSRYQFTVQNGNDFESGDALVIHDGSAANLVMYAQTWTNVQLGTLSANLSSATGETVVNVYYTGAEDNEQHYYVRRDIQRVTIHSGADPGTLTGTTSEVNTIRQLGDIAQNADESAIADLIETMVANDIYGDAIEASLVETRNNLLMQRIGITARRADPKRRAEEILSRTGTQSSIIKLTEAQKRVIVLEAATRGVSAQAALSHATMYGINRAYYEDRGYQI